MSALSLYNVYGVNDDHGTDDDFHDGDGHKD